MNIDYLVNQSKAINDICSDFIRTLGLHSFEYAKVYDDGSGFVLYSDIELLNCLFKMQGRVTVPIPEEDLADRFWYIPSEKCEDNYIIEHFKRTSGAASFADYVERKPGYYEMATFFSYRDKPRAVSQFMNQQNQYCAFLNEFKKTAGKLLQGCDDNRIVFPFAMRPELSGIKASASGNHSLFTSRELDCIRFLSSGMSAKGIAEHMNISPRTVEFHIENIKKKLKCNHKSEIVQLFNLRSNF